MRRRREKAGRGVPPEVLLEREAGLKRILGGLTDHLLIYLVRGLEAHRHELVAGRLYRSPNGGGCAVGVLLRELYPAAYKRGALRFWLKHGWRREISWDSELGRQGARLRRLEWTFDRAVKQTRQLRHQLSRRQAAATVGIWFADMARAELSRRRQPPVVDKNGRRSQRPPHARPRPGRAARPRRAHCQLAQDRPPRVRSDPKR
jgi:hypothetical protein